MHFSFFARHFFRSWDYEGVRGRKRKCTFISGNPCGEDDRNGGPIGLPRFSNVPQKMVKKCSNMRIPAERTATGFFVEFSKKWRRIRSTGLRTRSKLPGKKGEKCTNSEKLQWNVFVQMARHFMVCDFMQNHAPRPVQIPKTFYTLPRSSAYTTKMHRAFEVCGFAKKEKRTSYLFFCCQTLKP